MGMENGKMLHVFIISALEARSIAGWAERERNPTAYYIA